MVLTFLRIFDLVTFKGILKNSYIWKLSQAFLNIVQRFFHSIDFQISGQFFELLLIVYLTESRLTCTLQGYICFAQLILLSLDRMGPWFGPGRP